MFSPRLAPDDDTRVAEVLTHSVVAGGKIDERASFLASPFFPAKNLLAKIWVKLQSFNIVFARFPRKLATRPGAWSLLATRRIWRDIAIHELFRLADQLNALLYECDRLYEKKSKWLHKPLLREMRHVI